MALNAIERHLLIDARERLANGSTHRICYALQLAAANMRGKNTDFVAKASTRLREFIMKSLEGHFGFEFWLKSCAGREDIANDPKARRAARIAWIDWLLDEPWTDHNGGRCPLLAGETVSVRLRGGREPDPRKAETFRWNHIDPGKPGPWDSMAHDYDIVAYKVHYQPARPLAEVAREFTPWPK
jgi:hypothetical protein